MPSAHRSLTPEDVRRFVERECFATSSGRVGAEVEWLTIPIDDPAGDTPYGIVKATVDALGALPGGSSVTYEPGGQLELSSPPSATATETCNHLAGDERIVRSALEASGVTLAGIGLDPVRRHRRVLHLPRYAAMESYFDAFGPEGRRMMCRTAAVQVNVDSGNGETVRARWAHAHAIGPVLAAMFANSPLFEGAPTGWKSSRLATWWAMDRSRTAPANPGDPIASWSDYIMEARVMFVRVREDWYEPVAAPMTFGAWMADGHEQGFPTHDDLIYHTTTLFPPVRARSWLELRMIDALPQPWWRVAVAVTAALLDDEEAAGRAGRACADTAGMWLTASRCALEDPHLARSARECMIAALEALPRNGADSETMQAASQFADRFVFRGRTPADELIEQWLTTAQREPAWT